MSSKLNSIIRDRIAAPIRDEFASALSSIIPGHALEEINARYSVAEMLCDDVNGLIDWRGSVDDFVRDGVQEPQRRPALRIDDVGRLIFGDIPEGSSACYWDGSTLVARPYQTDWTRLNRRKVIRDRLVQSRQGLSSTTIVDLGSGIGQFSALLSQLPAPPKAIINVEREIFSLAIGQVVARRLGIQDRIKFVLADISAAMSTASGRETLANTLWNLAEGGEIIVTSCGSLFPFMTADTVATLIDWMARILQAAAGFHVESAGHFSPAYLDLQQSLGTQLPLDPRHAKGSFNSLNLFVEGSNTGAIQMVRHEPWLPQFVTSWHAGYFEWKAR